MALKLADRMADVAESSTLKMAAAARELASRGVRVVAFSAGEPDFSVHPTVQAAVQTALEKGYNKYTAVGGIPELRQRISQKLLKENGLSYAADQVVVTTGAKQAIFNFLLAVVSPGDEVLIPSPYWVSYPEMVKLCGGVPVVLEGTKDKQYKLTPDVLRSSLTPKTKVLLLNSPSNPCGIVYSKSELRDLAAVLEGTDIWVCSDEIYEKLIYEGEFCSFGAVSQDAFQRTVTVNGFSKTYAMTGWRLGYAAGPKSVISAMTTLQGQSTSNACSLVQYAGLAALNLQQSELQPMIDAFRRRRDRMVALVRESGLYRDGKIDFIFPAGAFYLFLNIERLLCKQYNHDEVLSTSEDLAMYLLDVAHVACVAGSGFGHPGFLRFSFAVSDEDVEQGMKQVLDALGRLR